MLCYRIRWWNKVVYIARLVLAFSSSIADLAGCSLTDCSRWSSQCSDVTGTWNWWSPSLHSSWQVRTIELPSGFVKRSFRGRTLSRYSDQTHTHIVLLLLLFFCFFWPSVDIFPREFKNWDIQNWVQIYQSVQSGVGKLSSNKTALLLLLCYAIQKSTKIKLEWALLLLLLHKTVMQ